MEYNLPFKNYNRLSWVNFIYLQLSMYIFFEDYFPKLLIYFVLSTSAIGLLLHWYITKTPLSYYQLTISILLVGFIIINVLSAFFSDLPETTLKITVIKSALLLISVGLVLQPEIHINVIKYFLIFSTFHALFTLFSYVFPSLFINSVFVIFPNKLKEIFSYFYSNGVYSGLTYQIGRNVVYISIGFMIIFSYVINNKTKFKQIAVYTMIGFLIAMLLTGKRGSLLAIAISCLILMIIDARYKNSSILFRLVKVGITAIVLILLLSIIAPETAAPFVRFIDRFGGDITSGRLDLYSNAFKMFLNNPIIGSGNGVFTTIYGMGVHSLFLQLMAENGMLGLLCFLSIIVFNIMTTLNRIKVSISENRNELTHILYFSILFQMYFVFHGMFENVLQDEFTFLAYTILASIPYGIEVTFEPKQFLSYAKT